MINFEFIENDLKKVIEKTGITSHDSHFNRTVKSITCTAHIPLEVIRELQMLKINPKFEDDYKRMKPTLDAVIYKAQDDRMSRQLLVLNTDDYLKVQQCFQLIQFCQDAGGKFAVQVYQRSCDMKKVKDDLVFFCSIIERFERETRYEISKLIIVYGNLHTEIENQTNLE